MNRIMWTVVILLAVLLLVTGIQAAQAGGSCPTSGGCTPTDPAPTSQPGKKKHTITAREVMTVGLLVGTPIYCGWRRWVENDPCVDFSQWRQTSAADDRLTPAPPTPGFGLNVEVTK